MTLSFTALGRARRKRLQILAGLSPSECEPHPDLARTGKVDLAGRDDAEVRVRRIGADRAAVNPRVEHIEDLAADLQRPDAAEMDVPEHRERPLRFRVLTHVRNAQSRDTIIVRAENVPGICAV